MILFETIVAALCIANLNCADSEEYSLGQENKIFIIHRSGGDSIMAKDKKRKREYFRKCGVCGRRFNQKDMIRDDRSDNGWICTDCHNDEYHDYEIDDF